MKIYAWVFAANLLIMGLLVAAFGVMVSRSDLWLAALPAAFALAGLLLQPWLIPLIMVPYGGPLLALFVGTWLTVLIYRRLDRSGRLEWAKSARSRLMAHKLLPCVVVIAVAGLCLVRFFDISPFHNKAAPPMVRWHLKSLGIAVEDSRSRCLGQLVDSKYVWQARMSQPDAERLFAAMKMVPLEDAAIPEEFKRMPPWWWEPSSAGGVKVYSTPDFPAKSRGPDGDHSFGTWEPAGGIVHLWVKRNF